MNFPKVSIIIPVFNPGNLLVKCLDSVKNQSMEEIEIICIDDGSTDNSLEVLERYEKFDSRFKIFHQENLGAGFARNRGIDYSNGEFILFVDSDDFIEENTCEILYNLAKNLYCDLILFDAVCHMEDNRNLNIIHFSKNNPNDFNYFSFDYNYTKDKVFYGDYGVIWTKFYKSSFLKENNIMFPNHKIYNDVEFHVKTLTLAKNIGYSPNCFYHYNSIGQSSLQTSHINTRNVFVFFDVLDNILSFLNENNLYEEFKIDFIDFSIFELKNKLKSIDECFKQDFFEMSKQFFYSLNLCGDDFNDISDENFIYFFLVINSKNYNEFYLIFE